MSDEKPKAEEKEAAAKEITAQEPVAKEPKKIEKKRNCSACNKGLKKRRWYYRNGKYYCTKRCWKSTLKKKEEPAVGAS